MFNVFQSMYLLPKNLWFLFNSSIIFHWVLVSLTVFQTWFCVIAGLQTESKCFSVWEKMVLYNWQLLLRHKAQGPINFFTGVKVSIILMHNQRYVLGICGEHEFLLLKPRPFLRLWNAFVKEHCYYEYMHLNCKFSGCNLRLGYAHMR